MSEKNTNSPQNAPISAVENNVKAQKTHAQVKAEKRAAALKNNLQRRKAFVKGQDTEENE